jgi:xylulokinase
LEGLTYQVHRAVASLKEQGIKLDELWLVGGASRNVLLPQMIADGLGLKVCMTAYSHGPALGAAILALLATGEVESLGEARERFSLDERAFKPEEGKHEMYLSLFNRYEEKNRYE